MKNLLKFRMKAFALIAILLVSISGTFAQQEKIVIIDAGSSKSKLYVYTVDKGQKKVECIDSKVPTATENGLL